MDELNAALGWAAAAHEGDGGWLYDVQNRLFDIGAELAAGGREQRQWEKLTEEDVRLLEQLIDMWQAEVSPLRSFILPGGSEVAARLHICRTVARRAERRLVALQTRAAVRPVLLQYLNRLSDLLFVAARRANALHGVDEPKYVPRDTD